MSWKAHHHNCSLLRRHNAAKCCYSSSQLEMSKYTRWEPSTQEMCYTDSISTHTTDLLHSGMRYRNEMQRRTMAVTALWTLCQQQLQRPLPPPPSKPHNPWAQLKGKRYDGQYLLSSISSEFIHPSLPLALQRPAGCLLFLPLVRSITQHTP